MAIDVEKFYEYGKKLLKENKADQCLEIFQASVLLISNPKLLTVAGLAAEKLHQFSLALSYFYKAIELAPDYPAPYLYALRTNEKDWNDVAAEKVLDDSLIHFPDDAFLLYAKAEYLLRNSRYEEGWKYFENRTGYQKLCEANKDIPLWDGSNLNGRTLLVAGEQGLGDHIMFARYLSYLEGNVVCYLQIPRILDRLLKTVSSIPVYSKPEDLAKIDKIDCWTAMGSLPFNLKIHTPPTPLKGYIIGIDAERYNIPGKFKVGLCWRGNPLNPRDAFRSMSFSEFQSLLDFPGCTFYSIQKDERESGLVNLCDETDDMADFAAVISKLDLVITVDTSAAHIAAALGKPTWVFIGIPSDWRWGKPNKITSDWYSTTKLFWQKERNSWTSTVAEVKQTLGDLEK